MTVPDEEPDYVVSPADEAYVVSGNDGSSIDNAVVVAPAGGSEGNGTGELPAGPGGNGSITTSSDGPGSIGSDSGASFSQDNPGAVSETPPIETEAETDGAAATPEADAGNDTEEES